MDDVRWTLDVTLVSWRADPHSPVVAIGVLTGGPLPKDPTPVVVHGDDSVVIEDGARHVDAERVWIRPGFNGLELPSLEPAAVHPGARIEPLGGRDVEARPPTRVFNGASDVVVSPDYGGVLFATPSGMAPVDAVSHRIDPRLQVDLWRWYLEWDEATTTGTWSEDEFQAEGERLVAALNMSLAGRCSFTLRL